MIGSLQNKILDIITDNEIDKILPVVISLYAKRNGNAEKIVKIAMDSMAIALNKKDEEITDYRLALSSIPKKTNLSKSDKNIFNVYSYCKAVLNFPKFYEDAITNPSKKMFVPLCKFTDYDKTMWQLFKEIVIPAYNENDTWFSIDNGERKEYTKWCIEHMDIIEKE